MESCGSCSGTIAIRRLLAIRDEDNKLGHKSATSSPRVPSSVSSDKMTHEMPVEGAFKCNLCPRAFKSARARGGHQKAHRQSLASVRKRKAQTQPQPLAPVKKQKARNGARPGWSSRPTIFPSTYSYATALRNACLHAQPFADWRSHYDHSVRPVPLPYPFQTGTGGVSPAPPSAPADCWTREAGNLGREQGVREENHHETGIDLSLKL